MNISDIVYIAVNILGLLAPLIVHIIFKMLKINANSTFNITVNVNIDNVNIRSFIPHRSSFSKSDLWLAVILATVIYWLNYHSPTQELHLKWIIVIIILITIALATYSLFKYNMTSDTVQLISFLIVSAFLLANIIIVLSISPLSVSNTLNPRILAQPTFSLCAVFLIFWTAARLLFALFKSIFFKRKISFSAYAFYPIIGVFIYVLSSGALFNYIDTV